MIYTEEPQKIFKYKLNPAETTLELPKGAQLLSVGVQQNEIFVWAMVNAHDRFSQENRYFRVYATGEYITEGQKLSFLGTVHLCEGAVVGHVFEELPYADR